MIEKKVVVNRKTGLQARPAALFVQEANRFSSDVFIIKDTKKVSAKSIMGLMSLAISPETELTLHVDGQDEEEALEALVKFIETE
ncbi:HPr family phosphocarrier protein [Bacillus sp. JCM 19034]|uniref:HPr family phosphocarrier protein n=1 Tax=Bacillus sp. JCM 19034 TaxID=1481928 RepID=UPI0007842FD8|nr:HPr family phosphocarrier protein [Bacillus sp. JCM 19034]